MKKNTEFTKKVSELADELVARATTILSWPVVDTELEAGPAGPQVVLRPSQEWSRAAALEALEVAYKLRVMAFETLCPAAPAPKPRVRRGRGPTKS